MRKPARVLTVGTAAVALMLSGCSSGDDGGSPAAAPGGGTTGDGEGDGDGSALRDALGELYELREQLNVSEFLGLEDFSEEDLEDWDEYDDWDDWDDWEDSDPDPDPDPDVDTDPDPDRDTGPDGADTGAEISGIWQGDDLSSLGVLSVSQTGTGVANAFYYDPMADQVCSGLLFGDAQAGWSSMLTCEEDDTLMFGELQLENEQVSAVWSIDGVDGDTVSYVWMDDWDPEDLEGV